MIDKEVYFKNPTQIETISDQTPEQTQHVKIALKAQYSVPAKRCTLSELQIQHPSGRIENDKFIIDEDDSNSTVTRRIFDVNGFEIETLTFQKTTSSNLNLDSLAKKVTYFYDQLGYIENKIEINKIDTKPGPLEIGKFVGQITQILYSNELVNWKMTNGKHQMVQIRVPDHILTRDILENTNDPTLSIPGHPWVFRNAHQLNLTSIEYHQPRGISDPPIF